MLTKQDLSAMDRLLDKKIEPINKKLSGLERAIKKIDKKLDKTINFF